MKKVLITILAVLYLAATTGATVHMHYCMNRLVELKLWHSEQDPCGNCGMQKSRQADNGCCKDEHKQVKIGHDHFKPGAAYQAMELPAMALPVSFNTASSITYAFVAQKNPRSHAPPRSCDLAIYKRNCVFRI